MPYLTISDEQRLKLKNRELELRMKEDEERFKRTLEERTSKFDAYLEQFKNRIEALEKSKGVG